MFSIIENMFSPTYADDVKEKEYDTLVLSGGSTKGFATLGAIYYLLEIDTLDMSKIDTFVGCSSGSMICYLLAIGYTPVEIVNYMIKHKVFESFFANIMGAFQHNGIYSFASVIEHLQNMTLEKIGHFVTLGQVQTLLKKTLIFSTYNFTQNRIEYLTPETHPDLPCTVAIHMSSNLPFIFGKFKYNGSYYIDGGITDNFPIEQIPEFGSKQIYGIYLSNLFTENDLDKMSETEYISKLLFILCSQNSQLKVNKYQFATNCNILSIDADKIPFFGFSFNHTQLLDIFSSGYKCAKKALEINTTYAVNPKDKLA